jgi:hypothetical protein
MPTFLPASQVERFSPYPFRNLFVEEDAQFLLLVLPLLWSFYGGGAGGLLSSNFVLGIFLEDVKTSTSKGMGQFKSHWVSPFHKWPCM